MATKKRRISDTQVTFWYDHVPDITWDDLRVKTVCLPEIHVEPGKPNAEAPGWEYRIPRPRCEATACTSSFGSGDESWAFTPRLPSSDAP